MGKCFKKHSMSFKIYSFLFLGICYVRLLLLRADTGRVLKKKKTTFQKLTGANGENPVFNETLVFDMPPNELIQTVVLALVCFADKPPGPKHHRSDAGPSMYHQYQQQCASIPFYDDSLFHYSGNLSKGKIANAVSALKRNESTHNGPGTGVLRNTKPNTGASNSERQNDSPISDSSAENRNKSSKGHKEKDVVVGKVAFGCCVKNPIGRFHWEKMVLQPRTVVNEWHYLK